MARKLICGLLFLIMAASVLACGGAETRPTDSSLQDKDQKTVIIGGEVKFLVGGKVN